MKRASYFQHNEFCDNHCIKRVQSLRIKSKHRKIRTRKNSVFGLFSRSGCHKIHPARNMEPFSFGVIQLSPTSAFGMHLSDSPGDNKICKIGFENEA